MKPHAKRILIFCQDIPPTWGHPTAGGGVRCWGLASGLENQGHDVVISVPRTNVRVPGAPREAVEISHNPGELLPVVRDVDPDIVLSIQWSLASNLEELEVPLIIDLYGPLLIENLYYSSVHWESLVARKMRALYLGDYFLCGSQRQLAYFLPWLLQAGLTLDDAPIAVSPLTMPPRKHVSNQPGDEPHFVAAGIFWPWQNPSSALLSLLKTLDDLGRGVLTIVGGPHPQWKQGVFPGKAPEWPVELLEHPRVRHRELMAWDDLAELLGTAHYGVDLSLPNIERFLAAPTRVYHYLWSGLPVLLSEYLELAPVVTSAGAGWAVDPTDHQSVVDAVLSAVDSLSSWDQMSRQAMPLVSDWNSEPRQLFEFCAAPSKRTRNPSLEQRMVTELVNVYRGLGNAEAELEHLQKDVRDRDAWLQKANERLRSAEEKLNSSQVELLALNEHLTAAEERLEKVRRSFPYRIYRSFQILLHGPEEVRPMRRTVKKHRKVAQWGSLLRLTIVGVTHLAVQGFRKWKNAFTVRTGIRS